MKILIRRVFLMDGPDNKDQALVGDLEHPSN